MSRIYTIISIAIFQDDPDLAMQQVVTNLIHPTFAYNNQSCRTTRYSMLYTCTFFIINP